MIGRLHIQYVLRTCSIAHPSLFPFPCSPTAYLAFAATGASPSLGVPPLELNMGLSALWQQQQQQQQQQQGQAIPAVAAAREQRRKRHFSLEDCHHDESNDSNLSSLDNSGLVTLGAVPANEYEEEANHAMLMSFSKSGECKD